MNLRGLTGTTVIAIIRRDDGVLTPSGQAHFQAGDLLGGADVAEAIESAKLPFAGPASNA